MLKNKGILGINARNLLYIKPYNKKKAIRMADDKIKTKQFLSTRGVPVPKLYGVIKDASDLEKFDFTSSQVHPSRLTQSALESTAPGASNGGLTPKSDNLGPLWLL